MLLKLTLAPLLVVGSSLAGRRWGARVAGMMVAFPVVAGPILVIVALEHGARFGARAAAASLLGLVSLAVFAVVLAYAGRHRRWPAALVVSWAATVGADVLLARVEIGVGWAFALILGVVWVAHRCVAAIGSKAGPAGGAVPRPPWWDLPARAAATVVMVLSVTGIAARAGPVVAGVLAPFPVASSVVAGFVLAQQGAAAAVRMLAGLMQGLVGFAVFCGLAAVLLEPFGVAGAFAVAVAGALITQVGLAVPRRGAQPSQPGRTRPAS
ncbi:hypothetical protein Dvina_10805 [Dactylosporangium vinaceum]|nr:hypothetical protein Dvina_10805 [Dactylosporangium vinaceum]